MHPLYGPDWGCPTCGSQIWESTLVRALEDPLFEQLWAKAMDRLQEIESCVSEDKM